MHTCIHAYIHTPTHAHAHTKCLIPLGDFVSSFSACGMYQHTHAHTHKNAHTLLRLRILANRVKPANTHPHTHRLTYINTNRQGVILFVFFLRILSYFHMLLKCNRTQTHSITKLYRHICIHTHTNTNPQARNSVPHTHTQ